MNEAIHERTAVNELRIGDASGARMLSRLTFSHKETSTNYTAPARVARPSITA